MTSPSQPATGILYIVPTPIGNLEDITLRAIRILKEVDLIAAEDTRHTKRLLNHLGIRTRMISYYREKEVKRGAQILELLKNGQNIALVSDAGTPAISDPGGVLVQLAHENSIPIIPLPGPSALITAVSACGFAENGFLFLGFAPSKKGQRRKLLSSLKDCEYPVAFYESPHRIASLIADALEILGNRRALWARELTKTYEELKSGDLQNLHDKAKAKKQKGEFVLIIRPGEQTMVKGETIEELISWYRDNSELSLKDVSRRIASDLGLSRSKVYQQALVIWKKQ
jgi:16S rRNA (cytidine1402-2'-O)-methyltransferase